MAARSALAARFLAFNHQRASQVSLAKWSVLCLLVASLWVPEVRATGQASSSVASSSARPRGEAAVPLAAMNPGSTATEVGWPDKFGDALPLLPSTDAWGADRLWQTPGSVCAVVRPSMHAPGSRPPPALIASSDDGAALS